MIWMLEYIVKMVTKPYYRMDFLKDGLVVNVDIGIHPKQRKHIIKLLSMKIAIFQNLA